MYQVVKSKPNTTGAIVIDAFEEKEDALDSLEMLANKYERLGYEVSLVDTDVWECVSDSVADITLLYIREVSEKEVDDD